MEQEGYEGLLLAMLAASVRKVKAELRYAAGDEKALGLRAALGAIDVLTCDILHFVEMNAGEYAHIGGVE